MRRFRVERQLGRGGYGRVLLARELGPAVVAPVAIKLAQGMWRPCPDDARRARDEARVLAQLDHPSIVRLQSLIQTEHGPALILEYVPGYTLHQILCAVERLPVVPALELAAEVAGALEAGWTQAGPLGPGPQRGSGGSERSGSDGAPQGHERPGEPLRLSHRDIKPGNLMITPRGAVKVLDFGIARAAPIPRELKSGPVPVGTMDYMAPERSQRAGQPGAETPAGDIFGLGLVLFGSLTGAFHGGLPYEPEGWGLFREDVLAELTAALGEHPHALGLIALVLDMLEVDPVRRPDPAATRDRALALAREVGGEGLRPWAVRAVAGLPAPRPEALSGYGWEGVEIVEIATEKGEAIAASSEPAPAPKTAARGGVAGRAQIRRRRPARLEPIPLAPTWREPSAPAPPADPALLEPVPMPDPDPPRRAWGTRALPVLGLLALVFGLHGPDLAPAAPQPTQDTFVTVTPALDLPSAPVAPASVVASAPEPAAVAEIGLLHRRVHVGLTGEAQRAALLTPRGELPLPAEVRAGTYTLRVTFPGEEPIDIPGITFDAGKTWEIRCSASLLQCREIAVE